MKNQLTYSAKSLTLSVAKQLLLCLLLVGGVKLQAQQTPLFSAYHFNKLLVNPAFTGIDNEYRAFGFFRSQWGNMPGRPITGGATVEGSFWKDRIGTGLTIINDQIGIFNQTNISVSYSQKIKFAKQHQISIGLQGSAFINRIDFSRSQSADINDPSLADQKQMRTVFDLSVGLSYKWKGLLLGFSVPQVLQPNAKYATGLSNSADYKFVRHYNAFAQYRISLFKEKFNITPTVFMRKSRYTSVQVDATLLLDYKNLVFVGAGYRNSFGLITMVGVNIQNMFTVAYAFDYTTQKTLRGQVGTTHEITAGFHLPSNYKKKNNKETVAPNTFDIMLAELQRSNDSLSYTLRSSKLRADSLAKAISELKLQAAVKEKQAKTNRNAEQTVNAIFKSQYLTDTSGIKSKAYTLDKIYFEPYESTLLKQSRDQLNALVDFMSRFTTIEILIKGYSDTTGKGEENQTLSEARAQAVSIYLIEKGIAAKRLTYMGFGSQNPIADNNTTVGRKLNRRVEFEIVRQ